MAQLSFTESLVVVFDQPCVHSEEVERTMADTLLSQDYVKPAYAEALVEREKHFPTALDVQGINVAIPHCDPEYVLKGAICVGILHHPVAWYRMDAPDETCPVSLVVMLALQEAHAHLEMLQKVIALIQDQEMTNKIVTSKTAHDVYELLAPYLMNS